MDHTLFILLMEELRSQINWLEKCNSLFDVFILIVGNGLV